MQGKGILVIEQDSEAVSTIKDTLERLGYHVLASADGSTAVELASEMQPALLLLNLATPGSSGLEACKQIHGSESTKTTPIVLLTVREGKFDPIYTKLYGIVDFLKKPLNPEGLLACVRTHAGEAAPRAPEEEEAPGVYSIDEEEVDTLSTEGAGAMDAMGDMTDLEEESPGPGKAEPEGAPAEFSLEDFDETPEDITEQTVPGKPAREEPASGGPAEFSFEDFTSASTEAEEEQASAPSGEFTEESFSLNYESEEQENLEPGDVVLGGPLQQDEEEPEEEFSVGSPEAQSSDEELPELSGQGDLGTPDEGLSEKAGEEEELPEFSFESTLDDMEETPPGPEQAEDDDELLRAFDSKELPEEEAPPEEPAGTPEPEPEWEDPLKRARYSTARVRPSRAKNLVLAFFIILFVGAGAAGATLYFFPDLFQGVSFPGLHWLKGVAEKVLPSEPEGRGPSAEEPTALPEESQAPPAEEPALNTQPEAETQAPAPERAEAPPVTQEEAAPPPAPPAEKPSRPRVVPKKAQYYVQFGVFRARDNAVKLQRRLSGKGIQVFIREDGGIHYVLLAQGFSSRDAAWEKAVSIKRTQGLDTAVFSD
jgi:CheY-like chemotaxis protein/cell division septation protein DedD